MINKPNFTEQNNYLNKASNFKKTIKLTLLALNIVLVLDSSSFAEENKEARSTGESYKEIASVCIRNTTGVFCNRLFELTGKTGNKFNDIIGSSRVKPKLTHTYQEQKFDLNKKMDDMCLVESNGKEDLYLQCLLDTEIFGDGEILAEGLDLENKKDIARFILSQINN